MSPPQVVIFIRYNFGKTHSQAYQQQLHGKKSFLATNHQLLN